ncbi:MAG TPA: hypothetical protein DEQ09_00525 [Bacteroidales bacterium]|nr:hypothetical protein [Bacteroidales bacterium]
MKRYFWVVFLFVFIYPLEAQKKADYGVFGGVSYYMGDINPDRYFYGVSPSIGIMYRYNLHPRHALRTNLFLGRIRGDDLDFNNSYQQNRAHSFESPIFEWSVQFEFNFLPYTTTGKWWDYTPYFAMGGGVCLFNTGSLTYTPVIPFSVGLKVNIYKNLGLELEYGFRKTFYDNFDGLTDNIDPDHHTWTHNNDWYMFTGVTFTWKMFHNMLSCPAYGDYWDDKLRKRR